jgi:hypothetical protein
MHTYTHAHTHMQTRTCTHTCISLTHMHLSHSHTCTTCVHRRVQLTREDCLRLDAHCREFQALASAQSPSNRSSNAPRLSSVSLSPPHTHALLPLSFLSSAFGLSLAPTTHTHRLPSTTHSLSLSLTHTHFPRSAVPLSNLSLGLGFRIEGLRHDDIAISGFTSVSG